MAWLFNLAYLLLLIGVSPWLAYAAWRKGKYREGWRQKLLGHVPRRTDQRPCVWLHAVSVGEINLLSPLLKQLESRWPGFDFVISTTTKAGYDLARQRYSPRTVFYCPLDFSWAVDAALQRIRPQLLILAELELWPNLIRAARREGVRVAVINGRLSDRSLRGYLRLGSLFSSILQQIDVLAVQSAQYAARFRLLGARAEAVIETGSMKFDGVETDRQHPQVVRLRELAGIREGEVVFLAGSTQDPEEQLSIQAFREISFSHPELRMILVPRHPERFAEVARALDDSGMPWQRRSCLETQGISADQRILLVDTVGELRHWWGVADLGFVGGSLGQRGGQSMIEPAAYGVTLAFGPNTWNFRETVELLLGKEAAVVVRNGSELTEFLRRALTLRTWALTLGLRAQSLVREQSGAVERTVACLANTLDESAADYRAPASSRLPAPHFRRPPPSPDDDSRPPASEMRRAK